MNPTSKKLPPNIVDEASEFFVEFSEGDIDLETRRQFNTWLRRSPEHMQAYLRITAFWEGADSFAKSSSLTTDQLIQLARNDHNVVPLGASAADRASPDQRSAVSSSSSRALPRRVPSYALAASAVLACLLGAGYWYTNVRNTYATGVGVQHSLILPDGSTVALNSRSKIRWNYSGRERHLTLVRGQALFVVAKDVSRPFIVDSQGTHVQAVGTQFDVYQRSSGTTITVLEGKVTISPGAITSLAAESGSASEQVRAALGERTSTPARGTLLTAGEQLTATATEVTNPRAVDVNAATAWTRRQLVFHNTRLLEVVEEFNRYSERRMVVADSALEGTRIGGVFSSADPQALIRFLKELPGVSIEESAREIRIARENQ